MTVQISGTSGYIADFSNATVASRQAFQTSTANSTTGIYALPSGTSTAASWQATNAADPTNASKILIATNGSTDVQLVSGRNGTGTYLPLSFYTNGSQQAQLDTSGNLGLGVMPSATWSVSGALQLKGGTSLYSYATTDTTIGNNVYYNSGQKYLANGAASFFQQYQGAFYWSTASSGTANNAINFTQAMTLDASGNLGIGPSSPVRRLEVSTTSTGTLNLIGLGTSGAGGQGMLLGVDTTNSYAFIKNNTSASYGLAFFSGNGSEAARFDASGNLLVGTPSGVGSGGRVQVLGAALTSATNIQVGTNGYPAINFNNTSGTQQGYIQTNASTVLYVSVSDYRLKNTVAPMTGALAKVALLKPCTYKWNATGSNGQGFIAHELAEVCPDAVTGEKDAVDEDGNAKYQGIDTSFLVATLTAAIQELKAEFDAYKAEHP